MNLGLIGLGALCGAASLLAFRLGARLLGYRGDRAVITLWLLLFALLGLLAVRMGGFM